MMNRVLKDKLKARAEELYGQERHEEIVELLMRFDLHEDFDLALMLVRAFIDLSHDKNDDMLDSAEMLLMLFPNAVKDPRWVYQLARAYYYKERYVEAYHELESAERLACEGADFPEREDARELLSLVKVYYDRICQPRYSDEERACVIRHIMRYFGTIDKIISYKYDTSVHIEVAEIPPCADEDRDYCTMVTIGMGAHKMNVPEQFREMVEPRSELVMYLPPEIDDDMRLWAVNYMTTIARLPLERNSWCSFGHIFSNGRPLMEGTKLIASTLIEIQDADENAPFCKLPNGDMVTLYQIFPLYKEEVEFKLAHGLGKLIERMPHVSAVLDLKRENVCPKKEEKHTPTLLAEETDYTSKLDIGEFCAASKLITEKGMRVMYMRRILIEREMGHDLRTDSGWLFMSGRETGEFLSDPTNIELCRLNTICNIDNDVIPFLTLPFNSIVVRGADGRFRVEEPEQEDFELLS